MEIELDKDGVGDALTVYCNYEGGALSSMEAAIRAYLPHAKPQGFVPDWSKARPEDIGYVSQFTTCEREYYGQRVTYIPRPAPPHMTAEEIEGKAAEYAKKAVSNYDHLEIGTVWTHFEVYRKAYHAKKEELEAKNRA